MIILYIFAILFSGVVAASAHGDRSSAAGFRARGLTGPWRLAQTCCPGCSYAVSGSRLCSSIAFGSQIDDQVRLLLRPNSGGDRHKVAQDRYSHSNKPSRRKSSSDFGANA